MEPPEPDDTDALRQILDWLADIPFPSLTGLVDSGRDSNEFIKTIPHKDSKRLNDRRGFGARSQNDHEEEEEGTEDETSKPDQEIEAFLETAREKFRAYWEARPHGGGKRLIFDLKGATAQKGASS